MEVRVGQDRLSPRVEHGEEAHLGAEMARIRGDGAEGVRGRTEPERARWGSARRSTVYREGVSSNGLWVNVRPR